MSSIFDSMSQAIDTEPLTFVFSERIARSMISQFDGTRDNVHRGLYNKEELQEPEKAYGVIRKFMDKCDILKQTGLKDMEAYRKSAISHDLALACSAIPVETPEMASKLIKTTSELFEMRNRDDNIEFQLDVFAKQGRFLGDKKVAEAYLDATSKSFTRLANSFRVDGDLGISALKKYKSIVADHPEMAAKVLDTVSMLQVRFADNPYYKECTNDILKAIADNPRIDTNTRNSSKDKLSTSEMSKDNLQMTNSQSSKSQNKASSRPSVKDKAKVFLKVSKSYAGGKNLLSKLKEKMETFAKENPKLLTVGGAAAMFAGIGSMNPQLAAAGAIIMSAGIKSWSDKLKNMRGLEKSNNSAKVQQPKLLLRNSTLNNVVIGTAKSGGGR